MQDREEPDFLPPGYAYNVQGVPEDARLMGFDRNTEEGAIIAMVGSLNPRKPSHRIVAWLILISFALPVSLSVLHLLF